MNNKPIYPTTIDGWTIFEDAMGTSITQTFYDYYVRSTDTSPTR